MVITISRLSEVADLKRKVYRSILGNDESLLCGGDNSLEISLKQFLMCEIRQNKAHKYLEDS